MTLSLNRILHAFNTLLAKHLRWFAVLSVILLLAVSYLTVLRPKLDSIRTVGLFSLQRSRDKLDIEQQLLQDTQDLVVQYRQLNADDATKLKAVLPSDVDIPSLFVQVEAIALTSGLRLTNVSFTDLGETRASQGTAAKQEAAASSGATNTVRTNTRNLSVKQANVTFTVSGGRGYGSLKEFLTNIESSIRLLNVQSLAYAPEKSGDAEGYLIVATTYYLSP